MISPDAKPIANVSPYKRIELGAKPKQPEPKWVPVDPVTIWQKLDFGPELD
jgi:hypothetical protein